MIVVGDRAAQWVSLRAGCNISENISAIGLMRDDKFVAGVVYADYNGRTISMHAAIEILSREFLWFAFYYPFEQLNVRKVLGVVDSENKKAIRLNLHLGFEIEAIIKDAGKLGDLLVFSMPRNKCRWLNVVRH